MTTCDHRSHRRAIRVQHSTMINRPLVPLVPLVLITTILLPYLLCASHAVRAEQLRHASAVSSPGETTLKIEIGIGDSANITCRIFDGDSSTLEFLLVNTQERITKSSGSITLLDNETAVLTIRNASEEKWLYRCMSGKHVIGETYVYVGTRPANVTDFSCRGYDYRFITCTFTSPPNMVLTSYTLKESFDQTESNYYHFCNLTTTLPNVYQCNFTVMNGFYPSKDKYYFNLSATNTLGRNTQIFNISYSENVIPAVLSAKIASTTDASVMLSWNFEQRMYYRYGLLYDIRIRPEGFDWSKVEVYKNPRCESILCQLEIENLMYAYWNYEISVRVRAATSINDDGMWSTPWLGKFMTKARPPDFPPPISPGSYHIEDADEKEIRLYWQKLQVYEENGPNFHYIIEAYDDEGVMINKTSTTMTSAIYAYQRDRDYSYYIKAANAMGVSSNSSYIKVFHTPYNSNDYTPRTIATIYHNHIYEISWQPPVIDDPNLNYTVFWCLSKIESRNQCKGSIYFEILNRTTISYTTKPQNQTLNVAVSANYPHQNNGMHWTNCSADAASDLTRLEPRLASPTNSTITLEWSLENICPSIVKGYKIFYCEMGDTVDDIEAAECSSEPIFMQISSNQNKYQNQTLRHLRPFTNYRISILMYSDTKTGPTTTLLLRTKEAAPSEPHNLKLISVTSESVKISWQPPYQIPGHLQYYKVWWKAHDYKDNKIVYSNATNPSTIIYYTLDSLKSYTQYKIWVTAHTVEASEPSKEINITTKIGIPSEPKDIASESNSNFGELHWQRPEMPSGRIEFYVVELLQRSRGNNLTLFKAVSFVTTPYCRYPAPKCRSSDEYYFLQVHAVNVAHADEVDIFGGIGNEMVKSEISANIIEATQSPFTCENSESPYNSLYHKYIEHWKLVGGGGGSESGLKYFPSPVASSTEIYCSEFPIKVIMINILSIILGVLIFITVTIWSRRKIKKMKNIEAVLPDGLINHIPNCKLNSLESSAGNGNSGSGATSGGSSGGLIGALAHDYNAHSEKEPSDISCSFDCLVYSNAKENHSLISDGSPYKDVANDLKRLHAVAASGHQEYCCYEEKDDAQSLDQADFIEEQSTESTNSAELSINTPLKTLPLSSNGYITQEAFGLNASLQGGGYVQPQALAAMFSSQQQNQLQQQQEHQQQQQQPQLATEQTINANGYISIEALAKAREQNASMAKSETPVADNSGPADGVSGGNGSNGSAVKDIVVAMAPGNATNANNNSICGYVTQQQLAQYGQLLH